MFLPLRARVVEFFCRRTKQDFFVILNYSNAEVPAVLAAFRAGQILGRSYGSSTTRCRCPIGWIAKTRGCRVEDLPVNHGHPYRPAEKFFMPVLPGWTPANSVRAYLGAARCVEWLAAVPPSPPAASP